MTQETTPATNAPAGISRVNSDESPDWRVFRQELPDSQDPGDISPATGQRWMEQFYAYVKDASTLLACQPSETQRRQAAINLKLAVNIMEHRDLAPAQVEERNRAATAFNRLIQTDVGLPFQPIGICE